MYSYLSSELTISSEEHLSKARALFEEEAESVKANRSKFKDRNSMIQMVLDANHIHSLISLAEGKFSRALLFARQYIKLNYRAWATLENHERKAADLLSNKKLAESDGDDTADQLSQLSILHSRNLPLLPNTRSILQSSSFWPLVHRLYRGLVHTSEIFAYGGLFPEAQYYMEQGQKIAAEISSSCLVSQSLGLLGNFQTRIGESEKGMVLMQQALDTRLSLHDDHHLVFLHLFMASNLNLQKKAPLAAEAFKSAENTIEQLIQSTPLKPLMDQSYDLNSLERQLNEFSLNEAPTGRRIRTSKAISVKGSIGKPTAVGKPLGSRQQILDATNSSFLWRIKSQCLRQQAEVAVHNKKTDKAASLLSEVEKLPSSPCDQILNVSSSGLLCLSQALESMAADPVFCVLPESTVAQPSIISVCSPPDGSSSERSCQNKTQISPPKKGAAKGSVRRTKQILPPSSDHSNLLRQAHDSLIGVLDQVKSACSVSSIHTTTDTLTRVLMMLSALTSAQEDIRFDSTFALYVMGRLSRFVMA